MAVRRNGKEKRAEDSRKEDFVNARCAIKRSVLTQNQGLL